MNIARRLTDTGHFMNGSWKSTHKATGAILLEAAAEIERLTAENERLRGSIVQLLEMPAACKKDQEIIENVNRRKLALDLIGGHRTVHQQTTDTPL